MWQSRFLDQTIAQRWRTSQGPRDPQHSTAKGVSSWGPSCGSLHDESPDLGPNIGTALGLKGGAVAMGGLQIVQ